MKQGRQLLGMFVLTALLAGCGTTDPKPQSGDGTPSSPLIVSFEIRYQTTANAGQILAGNAVAGPGTFKFTGRTSADASYEIFGDVDCGTTPYAVPRAMGDASIPLDVGLADANGYFTFTLTTPDQSPINTDGTLYGQPLSIRATQIPAGSTAALHSPCVALPTHN